MKRQLRYLFGMVALFLLAVFLYPDGLCRIIKKAEGQEKAVITIHDTIGDQAMKRLTLEWKQYLVACHADSSYRPPSLFMWTWVDSLDGYVEVSDSVLVRRKPTFLGFMEFLEKQYKQ